MKPRILFCLLLLALLLISSCDTIPNVYGILPHEYSAVADNIFTVQAHRPTIVTLFGTNVREITHIGFASQNKTAHSSCEHDRVTSSFRVAAENDFVTNSVITLRELGKNEAAFYLCIRTLPPASSPGSAEEISSNESTPAELWFYAGNGGSERRLAFYTAGTLMPMWVQIILIITLFFLSGLFSGLNLGLMSLDKTELRIIEMAGDPKEKIYAKAIRPVREKGNLLLCTLLLGNVLVNTSLTILMDDLTGSGLFAVIGSTIGITIFGEIMPQAVCSRHGLAIGAKTLWLTKLFMFITFPVAFPVSFVLDKILGEEMGQVYNREKLGVLIREQAVAGTVATDEMNIITGALALTTKTVSDVMTPLSDAFMLCYSDVLDFNTMNDIYSHGYTRIPVFEGDRRNIRAVLNVKDLAFINTEDSVPVSTVCDFYNRSIIIVLDSTNLEAMLKEFRQGRAHMAFVERLVTEGEGDPYREMIGLVTLEDVIEEIIQAEIVDETDILTDNVHHQPRQVRRRDFRMFSMPDKQRYSRLSPQLKIAALRHLACNVESFHEQYICYSVLQSFLNANIVGECIFNPKDDESNVLYHPNQWANYAILLLQGRALVQIGNESLTFEAGPFVMFGETVLKRVNEMFHELTENANPSLQSARLASEARFVPDYLLKATTNLQYLRITAEHYLLARRLSILHHRAATMNNLPVTSCPEAVAVNGAKRSQFSGLEAIKIGSHDMFQNAWEHHVVRLRQDAVASTLNTYHSTPSSTPNQSEIGRKNAIPNHQSSDVVNHTNEITPKKSLVNSKDAMFSNTIHQKRNSAFLPVSGDVLSSRPDEIQAFVTPAKSNQTSGS
ncbi:Metal transporter cnnm2 [Fasciola gigantica]|uniref:Metal transporter cnnm2 n=1 Tax=Fasciola gigantica TaxID=46835 RepID=A0A504YPS7_FASGI|nr:Metal transporter cnnm2 [Fasciola gigantica]